MIYHCSAKVRQRQHLELCENLGVQTRLFVREREYYEKDWYVYEEHDKYNEQAEEAGTTGEPLVDVADNEPGEVPRERPWKAKKSASGKLARVYDTVNPAKAVRLRNCAEILTFREEAGGKLKLKNGGFCRVMLCPMCQWRRALKVYGQMQSIIRAMEKEKWQYVFLTLTIPNVEGDELGAALDRMAEGFNRFRQRKAYKQAVAGAYKGIEIVHDTEEIITAERYKRAAIYYKKRGLKEGDANPNYNRYHPHYHMLLAVRPSYFSRYYLSREAWLDLWRDSMRDPAITQISAKACRGTAASVLKELCKYTVKEEDLLTDDAVFDVETVALLDKALHHRRLCSYTGVMADYHKQLHLSDPDDPEPDEEATTAKVREVSYLWHTGYRQYFSSKEDF